MSTENVTAALERLREIAPMWGKPFRPRGTIPRNIPTLPEDYLRLVSVYGNGRFVHQGRGLIVLLNPYLPDYWKTVQDELEFIRECKNQEGNELFPYDIYPDSPGLLLWGYGEYGGYKETRRRRRHYFWLTDGKHDSWPVMVLYDSFTRFELPVVVFLQQLLSGDMDCSFLGLVDPITGKPINRIDPSDEAGSVYFQIQAVGATFRQE